jgi:hypothetical protein
MRGKDLAIDQRLRASLVEGSLVNQNARVCN